MKIARNENWFREFASSVLTAVGVMDFFTLRPFSHFELHPLFSKEMVSYLNEIIDEFEKKGITYRQLAEVVNPTNLRAQLYFAILDMKCAHTPKENRIRISNFFKGILDAKMFEDPFVNNRKNLIHTPEEIDTLLQKIEFKSADENIARQLGRVYAAGFHLVNGLYTDIYTDYGVENYGPYKTKKFGEGHFMVIKHLKDLRPVEIWPNTEGVMHKEIKIYCIYSGIEYYTSFVSCHSVYKGDAIKGLKYWAIEADGKQLDFKDLKSIEENIVKAAQEQWIDITSLQFEDLKKKCIELRCYIFNDIRSLLGLDWKPNSTMLSEIEGKSIIRPGNVFKLPDSPEERESYWIDILDPSVDKYLY